jgi:peptidoglycan/xylan/chitin deacetylase (PgdA/CDA1 family)
MELRNSLWKFAASLPPAWYQTLLHRDYFSIYYHVVSDGTLPHIRNLYAYKTPEMFEDDLRYLKQHAYYPITYEQLSGYILHGTPLPPKAVILTVDDGLSECFSTMRPLLLKYDIPCIFFITTNYLNDCGMAAELKASLCVENVNLMNSDQVEAFADQVFTEFGMRISNPKEFKKAIISLIANDHREIDRICEILRIDIMQETRDIQPYLTTEEVLQLDADGFTIGAHSLGHERFSELTHEEIEENVTQSCQRVQSITHQSEVPFAFPFTADGLSRGHLAAIRQRHPEVGLMFGVDGITLDAPFMINRFCGDSPLYAKPGKSNLGRAISKAWLEGFSLSLH